MNKLQDDLLEIYNNLTELSEPVLSQSPCPVSVSWNPGLGCLGFSCKGKSIYLRSLNYYLIRPDLIEKTWLLPEDYDYLMNNLERVIKSGRLQERTCVVPKNTGFLLYQTDTRNLTRGTQLVGEYKILSGTSWWFRWKTKTKYRMVL